MYRVGQAQSVEAHVAALPPEALAAFAEMRVVLEVAPWSGDPYHHNYPARPVRTMSFAGDGLVTYLILEQQRRVEILEVVWFD